ncbi:hypothetical protein ACNKHX_15150 [Shigella flexneri]
MQARWRFDGQRFRLVRYAAEPTCDNWHEQRLAHVVDHPLNKIADVGRIRRCRPPQTAVSVAPVSASGNHHQAPFTPSTLCAFATIFSAVKPKNGNSLSADRFP